MATTEPSAVSLHYMRQTIVLACKLALSNSRQAYGNLMAQIDFICKKHGIATPERIDIQTARRHTAGKELLTTAEWLADVRSVSYFVSTVFSTGIPYRLLTLLPHRPAAQKPLLHVNMKYMRCTVEAFDDSHIMATTDGMPVTICYSDASLHAILKEGMQLNILDSHRDGDTITAGTVVVEPDYLVDISAVAACFQEWGHNALASLIDKLKPRANSQQILLGNFAGTALDNAIHGSGRNTAAKSLCQTFQRQPLAFCTCPEFNAQQFKTDAAAQTANILQAVDVLFSTYDRERAILEPSFVCERLGLQGRVDLMTDDMRLLVEQKSGKGRLLPSQAMAGPYSAMAGPGNTPLQYQESHYVQLLLYYGVLRHNFNLSPDRLDIRLLYSKYPASQGLMVVSYYQQLFRQAVSVRNSIVAMEMSIAGGSFPRMLPTITADALLENQDKATFFNRYIRQRIDDSIRPLQQLPPQDRQYVERMTTFVFREMLVQKVGIEEGNSHAAAHLWNMPTADKQAAGDIITGLGIKPAELINATIKGSNATIKDSNATDKGFGGTMDYGIGTVADIMLNMPEADLQTLNFRRGDGIFLYAYTDGQEPNVCSSILYKGVIASLTNTTVSVRLLNPLPLSVLLRHCRPYAIEHAASDTITNAALRSLQAFAAASDDRRALLMGRRSPRRDNSRLLTRSYHPNYDDIVLKAMRASDYFLLQGPPGTGKTSMALRFLVEEELAGENGGVDRQSGGLEGKNSGAVLLTAYTNRAIDEICEMLSTADIDYLRIGSETTCDPRFADRLLEHQAVVHPIMAELKEKILRTPVITATTATLQSLPQLLQLRSFSLCIADEASQILEPSIVGLLSSDSIGRFILIGDHKQLPAVIQQPDDIPGLHDCRRSLFERLLAQEQAALRTDFTAMLQHQGRMHPEIAAFPNAHFYSRQPLSAVPLPHQQETAIGYPLPAEDHLDQLLKERRVMFLPAEEEKKIVRQGKESAETPLPLSDKVSQAEARIVADLLRRIYRQIGAERFDADKTVGVIVPYRNQITMIRQEIERLGIDRLQAISIDTVERYQGSQRDVIIYSFTISHSYQLDFLTANCFEEDGHTIDRKLNVAMTRARRQLLMTGNTQILRQNRLFCQLINQYSVNL